MASARRWNRLVRESGLGCSRSEASVHCSSRRASSDNPRFVNFRETVSEDSAGEVALELRLHEPGQARALVSARPRFLEERSQVSTDGGVQHGALRLSAAPLACEWPASGACEPLVRQRGLACPRVLAPGHAERPFHEAGHEKESNSIEWSAGPLC